MKAVKITLIFSIILSVTRMQAQTTDPIERVAQVVAQIDARLGGGDASQLKDQAIEPMDLSEAMQDIETWSGAKIKSHTSQSGLEFRGGYDYKMGQGLDDFYDDLYSYRHRLNVMLSWNMLSSGLFGRSGVEQQVALEARQYSIDVQSATYAEQIYVQGQERIQLLDGYINRVYREQISLYESLLELTNKLKNQGHSIKLEQAELALQISMVKGLIRTTPIEVEQMLDVEAYISAQESLDGSAIEALAEQSTTIESRRIDEELLIAKADEMKYWKRVTVSPYVKAQHYSDTYFAESRITANIGVTATLPILSGRKNQQAELQVQSKLLSNATEQRRSSLRIDIGDVAMELNRNIEELNAMLLLEQLTRKQIELSHESYSHKQLTMQEVAKGYIKLLDLHANIIKLIEARESLKMKLMLTAI